VALEHGRDRARLFIAVAECDSNDSWDMLYACVLKRERR
jgi:hypothetical protein